MDIAFLPVEEVKLFQESQHYFTELTTAPELPVPADRSFLTETTDWDRNQKWTAPSPVFPMIFS
jgi:hypothetical protein